MSDSPGITSDNKLVPNFEKLGRNGNFYAWQLELKLHFQALDLWSFVESPPPATASADPVGRKNLARCKRDLLLALEPDLKILVSHLDTAADMLTRLKRTFVGGSVAEKSKLLRSLAQIRYQGNYFIFFTTYQAIMAQMASRGGGITDTIIMQFLHKLPNSLNSIVFPHMKKLEESDSDTDFNKLWLEIYDDLVNYLISCGWFRPQQQNNIEKPTSTAMQSTPVKCWRCGKEGHFRKACPELEKQAQNPNYTKKQNWMIRKEDLPVEILLDSGASQHTCGDKMKFSNLVEVPREKVLTANGFIEYHQKGTIEIILDNDLPVTLHDVAYWKNAPFLISVSCLVDKGIHVQFKKDHANIMKDNDILYEAQRIDSVYHLKMKPQQKVIRRIMLSAQIWHERLNHCGKDKLSKTIQGEVPVEEINKFYDQVCHGCVTGKSHRTKIQKKNPAVNEYAPLEVLVADCVGPYSRSIDSKRGALIIGDYNSQFLWALPFFRKSEVPSLFAGLLRRLCSEFTERLCIIRTDNGTEFCNSSFRETCSKLGLKHQLTIPYEHEMHGKAENNNRIVLEGVRSLLQGSNLPKSYWTYAMLNTIYCYNRCIVSKTGISPWHAIYGSKASIKHLRIFGVPGYAHIPRETRSKLEATAVKVIFLGYAPDSVGYIVQDQQSRRIFYSRTFYCNEEKYIRNRKEPEILLGNEGSHVPASDIYVQENEEFILNETEENEIIDFENIYEENNEEKEEIFDSTPLERLEDVHASTEPTEEQYLPAEQENTDYLQVEQDQSNIDITKPLEEKSPHDKSSKTNEKPEQPNFCDISEENIIEGGRTRSSKGQQTLVARRLHDTILKFRMALSVKIKRAANAKGYRSYKDAVSSNPSWEDAYLQEIRKLEEQGELEVVPYEKWMKPLPFIEVLTEKEDNISGATKLKVRLAVRGDLQVDRPHNCYSPTAGTVEILVFITVMIHLGATIIQADCPAAYLNGRLKDVVYLYLPEGHPQNDGKRSFVYRCPASIYGLAVSGRVWYLKFVEIIKSLDFNVHQRCPNLFSLEKRGEKVYLLLYVDDLLIASKDTKLLSETRESLQEKLKVKCTTNVSKFVGIQISKDSTGATFLHQEDMITELGKYYRITEGYDTPMIYNLKWNYDSSLLETKKKLQKIFGELNYISGLTRPDIAFSVNKIARRLQNPSKEVFRAAKRIVAYLVSTVNLSLKIQGRSQDWKLSIFTDSSFADIEEEKFKSTGGFIVYLNDSIVSWKSKKLRYICTSTSEAELLAVFEGAKEGLFIAFLLKEIFGIEVFPIPLYCDNKAVCDVLLQKGAKELTKFMHTKIFKVKEWIEEGYLEIFQIKSAENIADCFTKIDNGFKDYRDKMLKPRGSVEYLNISLDKEQKEQKGEDLISE